MNGRMARWLTPAYLLLCLVLGGSQQSAWANAVLQIVAVGLLSWIAVSRERPTLDSARVVAVLILLAGVTIFVQLVPLPPSLWSALPGRAPLVEGYRSLGMELPWLPISQAPYQTLVAAFALLPPLAMLAAVQFLDDAKPIAVALLVGAAAAIILGQLQVGAGDGWRLYEFTNSGPVGFFANINHMGTLLLVSVPFAAALLVGRVKASRAGYGGIMLAITGISIALLLIGVFLTGSLAALLLIGPVVLGSLLILPFGWRLRKIVLPVAGAALIAAVYMLSTQPLHQSIPTGASTSFSSRQQIWTGTMEAIGDSFPVGTGLGTFEEVYPHHEDMTTVGTVYVNHAHNDYLEIALEFGLIGILLVIAFLGWWAARSFAIWRSVERKPFERAATIASAAILAHSVVDYPLRTAAIAAVFAMCVGLMIPRPRGRGSSAKHVRIG